MMRGEPLEVEDMRSLLQNIQEFTDSAEEGDTLDDIQTRLKKKQLREAAFLVEDLIDEYMIFEERKRPDPGCAAIPCEIVDFIKTMILRHKIKSKFKNLESQFRELKKRSISPLEIHLLSEDVVDESDICEERQCPYDLGCAAFPCEIVDIIKALTMYVVCNSCQPTSHEDMQSSDEEDMVYNSCEPHGDSGWADVNCTIQKSSPSEICLSSEHVIDQDIIYKERHPISHMIEGRSLELNLSSEEVKSSGESKDTTTQMKYLLEEIFREKEERFPLKFDLSSEEVQSSGESKYISRLKKCLLEEISREKEERFPLKFDLSSEEVQSSGESKYISRLKKYLLEEISRENEERFPKFDLSSEEVQSSGESKYISRLKKYLMEYLMKEISSDKGERSSLEFNSSSAEVQSSRQNKHSRESNDTKTQMQYLPEAPPYMDEADIVGFEAPCAKLIGWLLKEQEDCTVVCVVGMNGLGKTTLAIKVFYNDELIKHFDYRVWITVSQSCTVVELLRKLLCNISEEKGDISNMDQQSLTIEVTRCLRQKRYVVFFDDVCDTDLWSEIEVLLPNNMNGSRIFITTTNMDVAVYCKRSSCVEVHEIQPLNLANSLELFNKKAFFESGGNCPENLKDVCLEIVKKCKGLPLAIVAIGDALSVKEKSEFEWKRFSENLHSEMIQSPDVSVITQVFCFDYENLPSFLKSCLLYLSIYPEDYEIKSRRLIRQWIAEGFIKDKSEKTLEQVAEEYLQELIESCLVKKSSISIDGKVKGVRVYDLFFVLLREKARDISFCKFVTDLDRSLHGIIRRLSIATTSNDLLENIESSHVRSLLFFTEEELPENLVKTIPTEYKLLKVLDFESSGSLHVPENLGDLIHLKYLSFRNTELETVPKSIGELQNLETLDLRQTDVNELPKEISKLTKLRHLLGDKMSLIHLKGGIGGMESLQTLSEVRIDEDGIELIMELGKLRQLRKLSLFDVREGHGNALCSSISEMQKLEKLYIDAKSKDVAIDLNFVSFPSLIQRLRLKAKLVKLPECIPKLESLVELSMSYSQLTEDPLESLKDLPNLLVLNLAVRSYEGKLLHFHKGFQNLKELGLRYLSNLESIIIEEGALHSLKELTFMNIPKLKTAPSGINYLTNLDVLNTHFMPTEFEKSIAPLAKLIKEKILDYEKRRY